MTRRLLDRPGGGTGAKSAPAAARSPDARPTQHGDGDPLHAPVSELPAWVRHLGEEDLQFVKRMILASGSLKQLAEEYQVSYPTIRARLDRVIERVQLLDAHAADDPFEARLRLLVADAELDPRAAKDLLRLYRAARKDGHG